MGHFLLVGAVALTIAGSSVAHAGALGTKAQRAKEALALRLLKSPAMQREIGQIETLYRQDSVASTPSGSATLHAAAESLAMAAAAYAADEDADRPVLMWGTNAGHAWFGLDVPQSLYGIDCPDNIYRSAPIDGAARYEIRGKIKRPGPAQETFVLYSAIPGVTQTMNSAGHMRELGSLQSGTMDIKPDGTFTISIDSDAANGRTNHIQSDPKNRHMHLLVRDTLADWATQNAVYLDIRRLSGPPLRPPAQETDLEKSAAEILAAIGPYWRHWYHTYVYAFPVNQISTPWARLSGWGFNAFGSFNLADDDAWVITLAPLHAAYFGFQLADPWGIASEYRDRSGSFNESQAKPNADGTYTFVVAAHDPGVYNWLDTSGLNAGLFTARWQGLPASVTSGADGVRTAQVIKLKDLKTILPPGTVFVTPDERKAQLAARAASYARRLTN